jgi:pimeloyl-ACP methyl ester carboxylesterase
VLLLSGDRDPFAKVDLLRSAVGRLPHVELHLYPGIGHGLRAVSEDAVERISSFVQDLALHSGQ